MARQKAKPQPVVEQPFSLDDLPLMLTVEETARALRIGRTACYEAYRSGQIPGAVKIGRSVRVPKHRVMELLGLSDNGSQPVAAPPALCDDDAATGRGRHAATRTRNSRSGTA